ncbi:MAG: hypothetical protein QF521_11945 [Alphaproteobacteria bacterium]|jgi:hypothetical protein|nr:hypothetical protein [Alphaproteobacteria bacterium]
MTSIEQQFALRAQVGHDTGDEEPSVLVNRRPISAALEELEAEARQSGWALLALLIGAATLEARNREKPSLVRND